MTTSDYTLDDAQSDVCHLAILLDLAVELALEPTRDEAASQQRTRRLGTVLSVARDLAKRTEDEIEANFSTMCNRAA